MIVVPTRYSFNIRKLNAFFSYFSLYFLQNNGGGGKRSNSFFGHGRGRGGGRGKVKKLGKNRNGKKNNRSMVIEDGTTHCC